MTALEIAAIVTLLVCGLALFFLMHRRALARIAQAVAVESGEAMSANWEREH